MSRRSLAVVLACLLAVVAVPGSASAARGTTPTRGVDPEPVHVDVGDFYFAPATPTVARGGTVTFDFVGAVTHTATDASGLELFDTGNVPPGGPSLSFTYDAAGVYAFVCTPHAGMGGRVAVPMRVAPATGTRSTGFVVVWAAAQATGERVYDVQIRRPGSTWRIWRRGLTVGRDTFDPGPTGKYRFRARMRDTGLEEASRWSPASTIRVR
jgi:plastocyanin